MTKQLQMTVTSYDEAKKEIEKLPAGSGRLKLRWTDEDPLSKNSLDEMVTFASSEDALTTLALLERLANWPKGSTMTISADTP